MEDYRDICTGWYDETAGKLMNQARAFQVVQLKRYVALCVETEEAVKTGQMGEKLAVETVLIQIARRK